MPAFSQSRKELDEKRKNTLEEIEYVDRLLKKTTKEKSDNINEIRVIGKKLSLREKIINEYGDDCWKNKIIGLLFLINIF